MTEQPQAVEEEKLSDLQRLDFYDDVVVRLARHIRALRGLGINDADWFGQVYSLASMLYRQSVQRFSTPIHRQFEGDDEAYVVALIKDAYARLETLDKE